MSLPHPADVGPPTIDDASAPELPAICHSLAPFRDGSQIFAAIALASPRIRPIRATMEESRDDCCRG
jgi:hypothetical protein